MNDVATPPPTITVDPVYGAATARSVLLAARADYDAHYGGAT